MEKLVGHFNSSLSKAKELIKFENDHFEKALSSIERDQLEIKTIALIEIAGDEWNTFLGAPPFEKISLSLELLTFHAIAEIIRNRIETIKKQGPPAFWGEIESQIQDFSKEKEIFPVGTGLKILGEAIQSIEEKLSFTEWIIQTPRHWSLKWDQKENLDRKIEFLTKEIAEYQSQLESTLQSLADDTKPLSEHPFIWPKELDAVQLLLKISGIFKPKSLCADLPDLRLTATLIADPKNSAPAIQKQILSAQKMVEELQRKNSSLQQTIKQAYALADAGNHLKAHDALNLIPPTFRLNEQRGVMDLIAKTKLRLTQIHGVHQKLFEMDLQRLDWGEIEDFCLEVHETIHNTGEARSDYEVEASKLLREIEQYIKQHRRSILFKWLTVFAGIVLFLGALYFFRPQGEKTMENIIEIETSTAETTWDLYRDNGSLIKSGHGSAKALAPNETCFVVMQLRNRAALGRILWEKNNFHTISQTTLFANPFVRIHCLDSTGKNPLELNRYKIKVDYIPIPNEVEGVYLAKGGHRFTLDQEDQPDYDLNATLTKREDDVTLISPWVPVNFSSNVDDLFVSVNNSTKRLIPYRFYLPSGNHEVIFSDSRGDIRESRRIHVEGGVENSQEISISGGSITFRVTPFRSGLKLMINNITHSIDSRGRTLSLSSGEQRIQLFLEGSLVYESHLSLQVGEELQKKIQLTPK